MSPSYTNLAFDDAFTKPEVWGKQWIDDWFVDGAKMNGTVIHPRNVGRLLKGCWSRTPDDSRFAVGS